MKSVKFVKAEINVSVWKTRDRTIPLNEMTYNYLEKARTVVLKRIKINSQQLKVNSNLLEELDNEIRIRVKTERISIKDIAEIKEGQKMILDNEIIQIEDLSLCRKQLESYIEEGKLFQY